jgi:hypothetical protein
MESSDGRTYQNQLQHDQSRYDLGRRRLGRNLAYALSLRRERFDYVALVQLATAPVFGNANTVEHFRLR